MPGDIVVLAGKGHETYQAFKDETVILTTLRKHEKLSGLERQRRVTGEALSLEEIALVTGSRILCGDRDRISPRWG